MKIISSKSYSVFGTVFLVIGLVLAGISVKMYIDPFQDIADLNSKKVTEIRKCSATFTSLGYTPEVNSVDGTSIFKKSGVENWEFDIAASSYGISSCSDMELISYCFGTECTDDKGIKERGTYIKMKYSSPANK